MKIPFLVSDQQNLPKMQIRRCLPLRWRFISVLFFLSSIGIAFSWGQYLGETSLSVETHSHSELKQYLNKLNHEHVRLKQLMQVHLAIEKNTQRRLLERLSAVESENAGLKQELSFFVKLRRSSTDSKS